MKNAPGHQLIFTFLIFLACQISAQEVIFLKNPSFEGSPRYATVPGGWRNCAFNGESPPDLHPVKGGRFQVMQKPQDGEAYLGLVVRENGTVESIGQLLSDSLRAGQCYAFNLYLCRSEKLLSVGRLSRQPTNYGGPAVLKIWGGMSPCGQRSLLAVSSAVEHLDWEKYTFHFQPEVPLNWISFEAGFADETEKPYNGNILLDHASPIVPVDCHSLEPEVDWHQISPPSYSYQKINPQQSTLTRFFFPEQGGDGYYAEIRLVKNDSILEDLLLENCPRIGFAPGSADFTDHFGTGLKEVAVNLTQFKNKVLIIGISAQNEKLDKQRKKKLRRSFQQVKLRPKQFHVELLSSPENRKEVWLCGQGEIWLKIENLKPGN